LELTGGDLAGALLAQRAQADGGPGAVLPGVKPGEMGDGARLSR
jgi:hypothetical protein